MEAIVRLRCVICRETLAEASVHPFCNCLKRVQVLGREMAKYVKNISTFFFPGVVRESHNRLMTDKRKIMYPFCRVTVLSPSPLFNPFSVQLGV